MCEGRKVIVPVSLVRVYPCVAASYRIVTGPAVTVPVEPLALNEAVPITASLVKVSLTSGPSRLVFPDGVGLGVGDGDGLGDGLGEGLGDGAGAGAGDGEGLGNGTGVLPTPPPLPPPQAASIIDSATSDPCAIACFFLIIKTPVPTCQNAAVSPASPANRLKS